MPNQPLTQAQLLAENADLHARLEAAEQTLREILSGEADALFVAGVGGGQIFTLKGADQAYRTLIEDMSEGAMTLTAEGVILYANRRLAEMLKMPLEKVIGASIHAWIAPESRQKFKLLLDKGADEKRREQLDLVASDGTPMPIQLSVCNLHVDGMPEAFCLVATDLSEQKRSEAIVASEKSARELLEAANQSRRALLSVVEDQKQAEESLRQLNEELENKVASRTSDLEQSRHDAEQANQAKSTFLAAMSHEIRTPMNGVIGMVEMLQQSSLNGPQIEMTNIIHDSAFALLAIIDDILDFSKIEAGKLQIDSVPMSVADVVEGTCETMSRMALKKEVELTLFTDPNIPVQVIGDPGRLRQILVNLTSNAVKFSGGQPRPGKVSVRALLAEDAGARRAVPLQAGAPGQVLLEFRVTDNGIGIDKATQSRLFTPFTQADSSTTRNFGGTGLGLVISRELAGIMGGEITVSSAPDKGSVFSVHLPFKRIADVEPDPQSHDLVAGLRCLVVGGTGGMADDLATYLVYGGAMVERAADLAAVQGWIASRPPGMCIVLIDSAADNPPLDELRAAALAHPEHQIRFVVILRGQRREPRMEDGALVLVDGNVLTRRALLKAVAVAAGRVKQSGRKDPHDSAGTRRAVPLLSREEARHQGRLILVAEDNEINQKVILQQLALLGQTADVADNGRKAREQWQSGDYGLLLTDLHMPEMDGYELTAAIRAAEAGKSRIPIIAITANALKGEADHCREAGMDDYLSKPVQLVNLKAMLEKWLPSVAGVGRALPADEKKCRSEPDLQQLRSPHDNAGKSPGLHPGDTAAHTVRARRDVPTPPVDVNVLKKLVGDDEATIREFLQDFRSSSARIVTGLRTACAAGEAKAAGDIAHKLKSSACSVGALALGEICAGIEQAGKTGQTVKLAVLLIRFEKELAAVDQYLDAFLTGEKS